MCCQRLVCAACAAPVSEARCGTCKAAKAQLHGHSSGFPIEMALLLTLVIALFLLVART